MLPRLVRCRITDKPLGVMVKIFVWGNIILLTGGALLLAYGPNWYCDTVFGACGAQQIQLVTTQEIIWLALLILCPILLLGTMLATIRVLRNPSAVASRPNAGFHPLTYLACLIFLAFVPLWNISGILFNTLAVAGDFESWRSQRWQIFEKLAFPEFVVLYTIVPALALAAVCSAVFSVHRRSWRVWLPALLAVFLMLAIDIGLSMKKQFSIHLLMLGIVLYLSHAIGRAIFITTLVVVVTGFVLTLYISGSIQGDDYYSNLDFDNVPRLVSGTPESWHSLIDSTPTPPANLAFFLHSITSRSALPSFYYVADFPSTTPYTGVNVPFLGTSSGKFHNDLVNESMYPGELGTSYSGWAFALYSEAGLLWALVGSMLLGAGIGAWWIMCCRILRAELLVVAQALTITFLLLLNTDDWVNNAVSSYGILYPTAALIIINSIAPRQRLCKLRSLESPSVSIPRS